MKKIRTIVLWAALLAVVIAFGLGATTGMVSTGGKTHLYNTADYSYTNPYMRIIRTTDGAVWDTGQTPDAFMTTTSSWANTAIALTDKTAATSTGGWEVPVPSLITGKVSCDLMIYDAASPAYTDVAVFGYRVIIQNEVIEEMVKL